jgi:hypothetical protein
MDSETSMQGLGSLEVFDRFLEKMAKMKFLSMSQFSFCCAASTDFT